ncbi:MAG TPA: hypothetical protein VIJ92_08105 [Ginsengibacter sp.]
MENLTAGNSWDKKVWLQTDVGDCYAAKPSAQTPDIGYFFLLFVIL